LLLYSVVEAALVIFEVVSKTSNHQLFVEDTVEKVLTNFVLQVPLSCVVSCVQAVLLVQLFVELTVSQIIISNHLLSLRNG